MSGEDGDVQLSAVPPGELPRFHFSELQEMKQLSRGFFSVTSTASWRGKTVVVKKLILHEGVTIEREIRTWFVKRW